MRKQNHTLFFKGINLPLKLFTENNLQLALQLAVLCKLNDVKDNALSSSAPDYVNGQIHAPADLTQGKDEQYRMDRRPGGL
jgi:hypothetical protein